MTLGSLRAQGNPVLLVFADPGCGLCRELVPELGMWEDVHGDRLTVAVISRGRAEEVRRGFPSPPRHVLIQRDGSVGSAYQVAGTPSAVVVDADGVVASGPAVGAAAIKVLIRSVVGASAPPGPGPAPRIGEPTEVCCDGSCRTIGTTSNCSGCGDVCAPNEGCCTSDNEIFACRDRNDVQHCGRCPLGTICCDSACIDPLTDPRHCGDCGRSCAGDEVCLKGSCCPAARVCSGICCPPGQVCKNGKRKKK